MHSLAECAAQSVAQITKCEDVGFALASCDEKLFFLFESCSTCPPLSCGMSALPHKSAISSLVGKSAQNSSASASAGKHEDADFPRCDVVVAHLSEETLAVRKNESNPSGHESFTRARRIFSSDQIDLARRLILGVLHRASNAPP